MRFIFTTLLFLLFCAVTAFPENKSLLKFHQNGEFKILQFTDTHISTEKNSNMASLDVIKAVTTIEKPDLVIFTGDIVTEENPAEGYRLISKIMAIAGTPWTIVFGNHESEKGHTRKQLADLVEKSPGCLNADVQTIAGNSNFILQVLDGNKKAGALLYCMDSNSYSNLKPEVDGYGWFDFSQIAWYRQRSSEFTRQNNGKPLPALAFFHIPLPEYTNACFRKDSVIIGVRTEDESAPSINSGMFTAMLECGDVMGTFVGHDHLNDYIALYHNIALAYGRVSKIMKDKEDPLAGGRVIVLKEGKRQFDTWIREKGGEKVLPCSYPASFRH
jgi:hypothetical protein